MILDDRIAKPGDPDLDCFLTGLKLASVVDVGDADGYTVEAALEFDTTGAAGWWIEAATGEQVFPASVTSLRAEFGVWLEPEFAHLAAALLRRLSAWVADGSLIAMTSAPGKWTLLRCPGHPAGADQAAAVAFEPGCRHLEGEAATFHLDQRGLGQDHPADDHGGQVVELHPGGHAGLGRCQVSVGGPQRRFLAQGDEPGSGQNRDVAGAKVLGRVLVGDRELHLGRETGVGRMPDRRRQLGGRNGHDDYDTARDRYLFDPE